MNKSYYLSQGLQTQLTKLVDEHANNAKKISIGYPENNTLSETEIAIHKTCKYLFQLPYIKGFNPQAKSEKENEMNRKLKDSIFRQRDLDQVLKEGYYPTCSDIGLIFRGLMIAQDYPAAHMETFHEDYLFNKSFHGHVFVKIFDKDKSLIVNPNSKPTIYDNEKAIFPYIIFKEGLDSWDIGIYNYEDMHKLKAENIETLLAKYEENLKTNS